MIDELVLSPIPWESYCRRNLSYFLAESSGTSASGATAYVNDFPSTTAFLSSPRSSLKLGLRLLCAMGLVLGAGGCNRNPYMPAGQPWGTGQYPPTGAMQGYSANGQPAGIVAPQLTGPQSVFAGQQTSPQLMEFQTRVQQLDDNNRQLTVQLAQSQQQLQAFRERGDLLAKQLQDATAQNKQLLAASQQIASQAQGMQASMNLRGGARLTANNSVANSAAALQIGGARVIPDGDLVRVRIPADQLFTPGTAQPNPAGATILDQVASALQRQYPRQRVGIEGHTDTAQPFGGANGTPYQLAGAQAQAIMDQLVRRNGVPTQQLFVIAHGPNHPLADNQSPAGRSENRRIEIVIYPETF